LGFNSCGGKSGVGGSFSSSPSASVSANSLSFGNEAVGVTSQPLSVTLSNNGTGTLIISGIAASANFSETNNCGTSVAAGASCTVSVTFTPGASGALSGILSFTDSEPGSPQTVSLSGTGTTQGAAGVSFSPSSLSFGDEVVGTTSQPLSVTLTNNGSATLTVSSIAANSNFAETNDCGTSVVAGGSCAINVTFTPGAAGSESGTVSVTDNAAGSPQVVSLSGTGTMQTQTQANVTTYHNDNARTGQNVQETILTPSNVNTTNFGKLFSQAIDDYPYAQPLYVANVSIPNQGVHNVVYVATMNDSVYAFDADTNSGADAQPLWNVNFTNPSLGITTVPAADLNCPDLFTNGVGILSTPVIDTTSNTIYVLARTLESGAYSQRLHALDITTGAEKFGGPVAIEASAPGTGTASSGGNITFDAKLENQRSALLLQNGLVYIAWGSLCDFGVYHGWMMTYDATTLEQTAVWLTTPDGNKGAIWQSGNGPAGDSSFNTFISVANGSFDADTGGTDYGQSIVRVAPPALGIFPLVDYFTPYNGLTDNLTDLDVGSSGLTLLPDQIGPFPHLLVQGDKAGNLFLINRDNMGHYNSSDNNQIVQYIAAANNGMWSSPSWWNGYVYTGSSGDFVKAYSLDPASGMLLTMPASQTSGKYGYPGTTISTSSNGTSNGILWALNNSQYKTTGGQGSLNAYDATNLANQLYSSATNGTRDNPGQPVKFAVPTIVNGKVYIATQKNLVVYGLLK
jgi:hypothetical protein